MDFLRSLNGEKSEAGSQPGRSGMAEAATTSQTGARAGKSGKAEAHSSLGEAANPLRRTAEPQGLGV